MRTTTERRSQIKELIHQAGRAKVDELSDQFGVSEVTIRNDLRVLEEEGIVDHVRDISGPAMAKAWHSLADHPIVGDTKIVGLMGSLALTPDKASRATFATPVGTVGLICRERCFANNLVTRHVGDRMIISPPLVITPDEIEILITRARKALDETYEELKRRDMMKAA